MAYIPNYRRIRNPDLRYIHRTMVGLFANTNNILRDSRRNKPRSIADEYRERIRKEENKNPYFNFDVFNGQPQGKKDDLTRFQDMTKPQIVKELFKEYFRGVMTPITTLFEPFVNSLPKTSEAERAIEESKEREKKNTRLTQSSSDEFNNIQNNIENSNSDKREELKIFSQNIKDLNQKIDDSEQRQANLSRMLEHDKRASDKIADNIQKNEEKILSLQDEKTQELDNLTQDKMKLESERDSKISENLDAAEDLVQELYEANKEQLRKNDIASLDIIQNSGLDDKRAKLRELEIKQKNVESARNYLEENKKPRDYRKEYDGKDRKTVYSEESKRLSDESKNIEEQKKALEKEIGGIESLLQPYKDFSKSLDDTAKSIRNEAIKSNQELILIYNSKFQDIDNLYNDVSDDYDKAISDTKDRTEILKKRLNDVSEKMKKHNDSLLSEISSVAFNKQEIQSFVDKCKEVSEAIRANNKTLEDFRGLKNLNFYGTEQENIKEANRLQGRLDTLDTRTSTENLNDNDKAEIEEEKKEIADKLRYIDAVTKKSKVYESDFTKNYGKTDEKLEEYQKKFDYSNITDKDKQKEIITGDIEKNKKEIEDLKYQKDRGNISENKKIEINKKIIELEDTNKRLDKISEILYDTTGQEKSKYEEEKSEFLRKLISLLNVSSDKIKSNQKITENDFSEVSKFASGGIVNPDGSVERGLRKGVLGVIGEEGNSEIVAKMVQIRDPSEIYGEPKFTEVKGTSDNSSEDDFERYTSSLISKNADQKNFSVMNGIGSDISELNNFMTGQGYTDNLKRTLKEAFKELPENKSSSGGDSGLLSKLLSGLGGGIAGGALSKKGLGKTKNAFTNFMQSQKGVRAVKGFNLLSDVFAGIAGAEEVYDKVQEGDNEGASKLGGKTVGAIAGGGAGTILGGMLGSVVPVFGTALGSIVGNYIGSELGGLIGESLGKNLYDAFHEEKDPEKREALRQASISKAQSELEALKNGPKDESTDTLIAQKEKQISELQAENPQKILEEKKKQLEDVQKKQMESYNNRNLDIGEDFEEQSENVDNSLELKEKELQADIERYQNYLNGINKKQVSSGNTQAPVQPTSALVTSSETSNADLIASQSKEKIENIVNNGEANNTESRKAETQNTKSAPTVINNNYFNGGNTVNNTSQSVGGGGGVSRPQSVRNLYPSAVTSGNGIR